VNCDGWTQTLVASLLSADWCCRNLHTFPMLPIYCSTPKCISPRQPFHILAESALTVVSGLNYHTWVEFLSKLIHKQFASFDTNLTTTPSGSRSNIFLPVATICSWDHCVTRRTLSSLCRYYKIRLGLGEAERIEFKTHVKLCSCKRLCFNRIVSQSVYNHPLEVATLSSRGRIHRTCHFMFLRARRHIRWNEFPKQLVLFPYLPFRKTYVCTFRGTCQNLFFLLQVRNVSLDVLFRIIRELSSWARPN